MNPDWTRIITEPFRAESSWGVYQLNIGDKVEFYGQMSESKPGMALIELERGFAVWVDAMTLKDKSVWGSIR